MFKKTSVYLHSLSPNRKLSSIDLLVLQQLKKRDILSSILPANGHAYRVVHLVKDSILLTFQ